MRGDLVGVDVGGTKIAAVRVAVDDAGAPTVRARVRVPAGADDPGVVERIGEALAELLPEGPAGVRSVGVGLAGLVDNEGMVFRSPNAGGLVGRDVAGGLRRQLGVPVRVDNDANCVAVAAREQIHPRPTDLVAVTLGTGIGGGFVVGGRLLRGARGFAGEPGHMVVDPDGPPCPCGQRGCWERYASGAGLAALAAAWVADGRLPELAGPGVAVRGEDVTAAALGGSAAAIELLDTYAWWIALGVVNLVNLLDPEVVVLGGGLVSHERLVLDPVRRHMASHPLADAHGVRVVVAPGGPDAGAIGAALLGAASAD